MPCIEPAEKIGGGKCGVLDSILAQIGTDPVQTCDVKVPKNVWIVEIPPDEHWYARYDDITYGKGRGLVGFRTKKCGERMIFKACKDPSSLRELVQVTLDQARDVATEKSVTCLVLMEADGSFDVINFRNG